MASIPYSKVKSKFIKKKIKEMKWKDSGYIDDLIDIEYHVLGRNWGLCTGYKLKDLERNHPKEWKIIHQELDLKGYKKGLAYEKKEREREKKEDKEFEKEELKELGESKMEWKKAGGRM